MDKTPFISTPHDHHSLQTTTNQAPDSKTNLINVVKEYYTVFRNGYHPENAEQVKSYLNKVIQPNMRAGSHEGIELMYTQWKLYTERLQFTDFQLQSFEYQHSDEHSLVETKGSFRFIISHKTIEGIFPHIIKNDKLLHKLLGLELQCECDIKFYFDNLGKVIRYGEDADFKGALQSVITDPSDLNEIMDKALIGEESMLQEL